VFDIDVEGDYKPNHEAERQGRKRKRKAEVKSKAGSGIYGKVNKEGFYWLVVATLKFAIASCRN
jgi:hypothetical protein